MAMTTIDSQGLTPAQVYRIELVDYFDKTGKIKLPLWIIQYLPLLGYPDDLKVLRAIEVLINRIPDDKDWDEQMMSNVIMNMLMMLIRMRTNNIIIL